MKVKGLFEELASRRKVLVLGHRGMSQYYPENTMASFLECAKNPRIDGIELDVHVCKSGEVVVAHDFSLKRTAEVDAEIEDLTWDELKAVNVGWFRGPEFADARVPLLSEVLGEFGDRFIYDIELKVKTGKLNLDMSKKVAKIVRDYGLEGRVMISSFNPVALGAFGSVNGQKMPKGDIFEHAKSIPKFLQDGAGHILSRSSFQKPCFKQIDDAYLAKHGKRPIVTWTVNEAADAERMLSYNKDQMYIFGLIGNDPAMLADVVKEWK